MWLHNIEFKKGVVMGKRQDELQSLLDRFRAREKESLDNMTVPEDAYLCVRMDGIRHSKNYLKDSLENIEYKEAIGNSIKIMHKVMRKLFNNDYQENFICVCSFSDEVSVILINKIKNKKFKQRTMKICSLCNGNMSSIMTK